MTSLHVHFHQCNSISHVFIHWIDTERLPRNSVDIVLVSEAHDFQRLQTSIFVCIATFPASNKTCGKYLNNSPVSVMRVFRYFFSMQIWLPLQLTTFQNHFKNLLGKQQHKMKVLTCSCPNENYVTNLHLILSIFKSSVFRL